MELQENKLMFSIFNFLKVKTNCIDILCNTVYAKFKCCVWNKLWSLWFSVFSAKDGF